MSLGLVASGFQSQLLVEWVFNATATLRKNRPAWNVLVEGFGNHDPGTSRYKRNRPVWDEIHSGRACASRCKPPKWTRVEIFQKLEVYLIELKNRLL